MKTREEIKREINHLDWLIDYDTQKNNLANIEKYKYAIKFLKWVLGEEG